MLAKGLPRLNKTSNQNQISMLGITPSVLNG